MVRACVIGDGGWVPPGAEDDEWRGVVTLEGVPVARLSLPDPGETDEAFRRAAIDRRADRHRAYTELLERMERRLGVPKRRPAPLTTSVVVCTRRRPKLLAGLLEAIEHLDPHPRQLIVVDNDPDNGQTKALAERADADYVHEPRHGLDNARRAGIAAATGDLIAFTDDDCLPSERWLRDLPELFDDPRVAAVTGPAFAHELDSPAKRAFEDAGGFGRGFHRRVHEWVNLSPPGASRAGAGANMVLRRAVLDELGELFPPELDSGTPTRSGGDLYALYRVLAAGYRVVYDPGTYVLHRHRADLDSMRRAIRGYGVGLSATLSKLLVEERELGAAAAWAWLVKQWLESIAGDELRRRIGRDYLQGAFGGPTALRAARRNTTTTPAEPGNPAEAPPAAALQSADNPDVSVIVTTHRRPDALRRCVDALARQQRGTPPFELIVVNDAARPLEEQIPGARIVDTGGVGTGGARNAGAAAARGALLLFLDDDLVPEPGLVAHHAAAHRASGEHVAIGYCPPRPGHRNLASFGAAAWWEDHYRALRDAASLTFMDVLSGNMSVPRDTFRRIGGFDPELDRREDWEWGIRVLEAGVQVVYEPSATASHEFRFGTRAALAAGRKHGRSDAVLIARHPEAVAALPTRWSHRGMLRRPFKAALFLAFQRTVGQWLGILALGLLERAKLRPTWSCLFSLMLGAAYERGRRDGGDERRPAAGPPVAEIELDSDEPIPAPPVMTRRIRLLAQGEPVAEFSSYGGHWGRGLAEQIAAAGHWEWWRTQRTALEAADVELISQATWSARNRAIRASRASVVAIPLRSAPSDGRWLAEAAEATRAGRVALAIGTGLDAHEPPHPVTLHSRQTDPDPFPAIGRPPAYLALGRDAYLLLGGFDLRLAKHGDEAVLLELVQRALSAGWLVARRDVPGLPAAGRAASLRITRTRALLQARAARERRRLPPLRPALVRLTTGLLPGGPSAGGGIAHAAAWLVGIIAVAARPRYRSAALSPAAFDASSGRASQRWAGRSRPIPADLPVTRSG